MPCVANINGPPAELVPPTELDEPAEGQVDFPVGAECVTFTFELCANELAVSNQVEVRVFWSSDSAPLTQEVVLQQTLTCGEFETCFAVYQSPPVSPPGCIAWDLSFPIPAGKNDVQVTVTEVGDVANPGTVTVWVAFK